MNSHIPIQRHEIGGVVRDMVDGRDLWRFVQPYATFANWMRAKIIQHHFTENQDYLRVKVMRQIPHRWHYRVTHQIDYRITTEMANTIGAAEYFRGSNSWK